MLANLNVPHMFTAPASYGALPVEAMFGRIKLLDLDPVDLPDYNQAPADNNPAPNIK